MKWSDKNRALFVFTISGSVLATLLLLTTGISGEVDSITHFQFAKYALKHPELYVHHWGKPLFTILCSPLAQFGYTGAMIFNLICGLVSGWFVYLITNKMGYRFAWLATAFTVFIPLYLFVMFTSLTEILFSLVLIISIYLFIDKRYIWSAIIISLIPFARAEGLLFILIFLIGLIWMKQYKALPYLLTGFVLFGLLGIPVYHDFLWYFTQMPYSASSAALYGSGSFWVYFKEFDLLIGYPVLILGIAGLLYLFLNIKPLFGKVPDVRAVTVFIIIIPGLFLFLIAQSFLWWKGFGILASDRFIACILPLIAILSVSGFEWVMSRARFHSLVRWLVAVFMLVLVISKPFTYHQLPMKVSPRFATMEKLTTWLKASPYHACHPIFTDPAFPFYMGIDPFDSNIATKIYSYAGSDPATQLKTGELMIWDTHFAGFEGHLPFDSIMKNPNFQLLRIFVPDEQITIFGQQEYKLAVFRKAPKDSTAQTFKQLYINNFDNDTTFAKSPYSSTDIFFSGSRSMKLTPQAIYSPNFEKKLINLPDSHEVTLKASVKMLNPSDTDNDKIFLIVSVEDDKHTVVHYHVARINSPHKSDEWVSLSQTVSVNRDTPVDGILKVYVWYAGTKEIYVDDLLVEYLPD